MAVPPQSVRNNAKRGLELRRKHGRGGTAVGVARARDLANGKDIPEATLRRMNSFFARHGAQGAASAATDSAQNIAWLLWGGSAGRNWVRGQLKDSDKSYKKMADSHTFDAEIAKVSRELGMVFGYAIVSKIDDEPYFDLHGDHIPEDVMMEAAADFMKGDRTALEMHGGESVGKVVFAYPMTKEIAESLGMEVYKTGLIIGMQPNEEVLGKFDSGEYTGFSIGGTASFQEVDEDDDDEKSYGRDDEL